MNRAKVVVRAAALAALLGVVLPGWAGCVRTTEGLSSGTNPTRGDGAADTQVPIGPSSSDVSIDPSACLLTGCDAAGERVDPPVGAEAPDALVCGPGVHACGGICVRDDDPLFCGPACAPCPAPPGAQAACNSGRCEFTCGATGRRCNDQCVTADQPCDGQCLPGFSNCRDSCVPTAVVGPEICDGKDNDCNGAVDDDLAPKPCSPACSGQQKCTAGAWSSASCSNIDVDAKHCGPMCAVCPGPPGGRGHATCVAGVCKFSCEAPAKPVGDHCGCRNDAECPANHVCLPDGACKAQAPVIRVVSGFYGKATCEGKVAIALPPGTTFNQTKHLAGQCNGKTACDYKVDHTVIGDPYVGCAKDYQAVWECVSGATVTKKMASVAPEASGKAVRLVCP